MQFLQHSVFTRTLPNSSDQLPVSVKTLRTALEGIVKHVRFPTMAVEEFANGPAAQAILTAEVGSASLFAI